MKPVFRDRRDAGRRLAAVLGHLAGDPGLLVLGLPRGGVPVAAEVAAALEAPLDVYVVRKLGAPGRRELAMGAIASGGVRVLNESVAARIPPAVVEEVARREERELERRERTLREERPPPAVRERTVVLVDDGIATGSTVRSAIAALRALEAARIVVAVPVVSPDTRDELLHLVDEVVAVVTPEPMAAISLWYEDFSQTPDEEVRRLLQQARRTPPEPRPRPRLRAVKTAELREHFIAFFEAHDHRRMASASLVPPAHDPSVLLTTAGMQPFKPYFRGDERPPHPRLTSCQKCFRTPDIENVGTTARHLTFFEMLGNFSVGDYFKQQAVEFALELSTSGFGFDVEDIWITVFGGDEALGLGPDEEAIEVWRGVGVPDERIVRLGREDNFWQAGPTGPCGPCSELYLDRGPAYGPDTDRPGDDTDRFIEFWNLVFMQYELFEDGRLEPLPERNIDTGAGLDRVAMLVQGVDSVFETDYLRPLIELGEELSGRTGGAGFETTRALRILADHGRGMTFLLADGVVPSNEDRGYVLRRIMRRAILQGRVLGIGETFLPRLTERAIEIAGGAYPELVREAETIAMWARSEEEAFLRTLEQGERLLAEVVRRAREDETSWIAAEDAFRLHDTFGFPFELTRELLADQGLEVDDAGFAELMDGARARARAGGRQTEVSGGAVARAGGGETGIVNHERVLDFTRSAGFATRFRGYEATELETVVGALERVNGRLLAKLEESPFYPEGGGQVSDTGFVELPSGERPRVTGVFRIGDDQALELTPDAGAAAEAADPGAVRAVVDRSARLATMANHTATHLLHAALRERLGTHVRQAGSYVGPDKLRFDFTHGERLSEAELADVEARVATWISEGHPVRALETTRDEAERLGAMALFGEKYGDWVRMVEVEGVSRELCGGTHVRATTEVGLFHITGETSSASNVRRIEAVTGPGGVEAFRARTETVRGIAGLLRVPERDALAAVRRLYERAAELERRPRESGRDLAGGLVAAADEIAGVRVVTEAVELGDAKALLELSDRVRQTLGESAVVLGTATAGRVHLVANVAPSSVERGVRAGEIVRAAAQAAGGGGGGRDTMAQAGGRDPEKLPDALAAARLAIEQALA